MMAMTKTIIYMLIFWTFTPCNIGFLPRRCKLQVNTCSIIGCINPDQHVKPSPQSKPKT